MAEVNFVEDQNSENWAEKEPVLTTTIHNFHNAQAMFCRCDFAIHMFVRLEN
jgi:hypothetical protein